jgi:ribose transport system permease protein
MRALAGTVRRREASVAAMLVAVALYLSFKSEYFLSARNLLNVGRQGSVVVIVALGQALVIIARGIDLSVGSVIGLSGVSMAIALRATGSQPLALLAGLTSGLCCGLVNGALVAEFGINSFIVTLGTLSITRGVALLATGGLPVPYSGWAEFLGAGYVHRIPAALILMLGLALLFHVFASRTVAGRHVYAIGDNPRAARLAGIDLRATRYRVFAASASLAALGGVILAGNLASADPMLGVGYEMDVIAAVILGGTALSGGRGSIPGVIIGGLLMALLNNAFVLLGVSAHWQMVAKGLVIIVAVGLDRVGRRLDED